MTGSWRNIRYSRRVLLQSAAKTALTALALGTVAPALVGCEQVRLPGMAQKKTLVYWAHTFPPAVDYVTKTLIPEWQQKRPDIEIKYETVPHSDFEKKLLTALAAGTGPDMYQTWDPNVPLYVKNKRMAPVIPEAFGYKTQEELIKAFMPGSLKAFIIEGKLYGVPLEYNTLSLWYRSDIYREVGLDPNKPPKTWDQLGEYAAKCTVREGEKMVRAGFQWPWKSNIWYMITFVPIVRQAGGDLVDATGTRSQANTEPVQRAMQIYADMVFKYKAADPAFVIENDFANGRWVSQISGIYFMPAVLKQNPKLKYGENFRVGQLPQIEGGKPSTILYAWLWTVNPASKLQREAWEWISFMSEHGAGWFKNVGYIQPRLGWLDSPEAKENPALPVFLEDFKYGEYLPRTVVYQEMETLLGQAIERVIMQKIPIKDSLQTLHEELTKALQRAG